MDYQEYKRDFLESLRNDSAINGSDTEDEFINRTFDILTDFDEISDPVKFGMGDKRGRGGRIMRADGYCFDETDQSLVLFISDFQDSFETEKLTMTKVDELYWRLFYFLDETCNGNLNEYFDDSDDILKIARLIKKRMAATGEELGQILKVKFFVLTNKELDTKLISSNLLETTIRKTKGGSKKTKSTKKIKKTDFNNKPLEINLWHIERIYEMENSNNNDPIVIDIKNDFTELGYEGIPCLKGNIGDDLGYEAYIAIIPGKLLAEIYIAHGSKVLEGNVRAFLGTGGSKSVNYGIKRTINTDGSKFFTYNNGIATTAADIEIEERNGEMLITKIIDLQIINGGQTTASLAEAVLKKTNSSLDGIYVPMKLTVIEDREIENEDGVRFYDEMVQNISKYANSQNKVTAADFFSNDPFHIWMEKTSKKLLAPPVYSAVPTGWYYERSRKRYQQEQFKLKGEEAKKFGLKFPKKQVINKEQLAMYITAAIYCRPDIVSRGKNWTMKAFGSVISEEYNKNTERFNEFYFKKCIGATIIFRKVDAYLEENKDSAKRPTGFWYKTGGYKGNIVPYTIAKIISSIPSGYSLDWDKIWKEQNISDAFMHEVEIVTKMTNDFICDSHGIIVTEYCKRQATWDAYKSLKYTPSSKFLSELLNRDEAESKEKSAKRQQKNALDLNAASSLVWLGADYWTNILNLAIKHSFASYQEQTALKEVIRMAKTGSVPMARNGSMPIKTMNAIKMACDVKDKLESEGIIKTNG